MPKKPAAYHRPDSLTQALELLEKPESVVLAGGTKLLADEAGLPVENVVDLQALGLNQIALRDNMLVLGATCTLTDIMAFLEREYPSIAAATLLREAVHREGPNTYRNAATIGGTVASRLPDSELLAALLVLEAQLRIVESSGWREIDLAGYLHTLEAEPGLIESVRIPWQAGRGASERVARTPADYPIVSIVAWFPEDGAPRLAATGLSQYPVRLTAAEDKLGAALDEGTVNSAADAAKAANTHAGDFRGDAAYRAEMAKVLTRRLLQELVGDQT
jgi:CO/xanthine dehydrogenase FAD-binding subunit